MTIGNTKEMLEKKRVLDEGEVEISERAFNLIIGGVLMWGFLLNVFIVKMFGSQVAAFARNGGTTVIYIGYLVLAIAGWLLISLPKASMSFLGYNLIALPTGIVLCVALDGIPTDVVMIAEQFTAIITCVFVVISTLRPDFFLSMGRALLTGLGMLLVGELVFYLLGARDLMLCWLGAGLFGMYIGYDWARCSVCACSVDNAVDAAANLYLDIINLFIRILSIVASSKRDD